MKVQTLIMVNTTAANGVLAEGPGNETTGIWYM